jgi:hypothetical protein
MNLLTKYISIGIAALGVLSGCGQNTVETVTLPSGVSPHAPGQGMTAVILPFADYSSGESIASAFRRHLLINEAVTQNLIGNGFTLPVQEDVVKYLIEQEIISISPYSDQGNRISSLSMELDDSDWSDLMRSKLRGYMQQDLQHQGVGKNPMVDSPGTRGLTEQEVVKIGRRFGADYVIRGQILDFRTRQEHSWDPRRRGLLPIVLGGTQRMVFGFADSNKYDTLGNTVAGGAWGALIGSQASGPWDPDDSKGFLGLSGGKGANMIAWSIAGGAAGEVANQGGRVDQAVVQMRLWVQSAYDANVVWTNRVDVRVSPESVLADGQHDTLFDQAIQQASKALIHHFVAHGIPRS